MPSNHGRQCDCLVVVAPAASICASIEAWADLFSRAGILGKHHSADRSLADPTALISRFSGVKTLVRNCNGFVYSDCGTTRTELSIFVTGRQRCSGVADNRRWLLLLSLWCCRVVFNGQT